MFEEVEPLVESTENNKKDYYIHGIFMQGNVKNRNGRIYPTPILEAEMNRYLKTHVAQKRALGELGHPEGPQINADRVCHLIVDMHKEGDNFIGKAKVLDTPMGKILKNFIDEGIKTGVSTRALGSVKPRADGIMEVQNDLFLSTVDSVMDPSGPQCFVNGIMENTQYYYDVAAGNWRVQEQLEETVKELKKEVSIRNKIDEAKAINIFEGFINSLTK
jgi:hypothetical protein